ncbi:hypothetical protein JYU34_002315 [Plutella xylostella]|uniref:Gustatory receptor n=1 Tax=Plutella xylostella TaxID=51655 RepID=A0ABQ7R1X8_PLUXY|nr:hypothetical protein JYU34_002315 [Plutella xylostella]
MYLYDQLDRPAETVSSERRREQLEQFLRYIQLRPFSYSVWRLLRVDGALPAALLALLTTYLIVIVQFTHLYG